MATSRDLLAQAKQATGEVDTAGAQQLIDEAGALGLDVREADEYEQGALPGAVHIPRGFLEFQADAKLADKGAPVVVYCAGGARSAFAAKTLGDLGYGNVVSMAGGFGKWKNEGRVWRAPRVLSPEQRNRYQRHLLLPEVDVAGQQKLLDSKVLLLGAGGLGSPAALYLAAAGVGTIGLIELGVVERSNAHAQVLLHQDGHRYHTPLLLPYVDVAGQQKLLDSKLLLLGAGGLGSPAALYLAAAGVGTIGIIDMDVVDASNLQRQVLHNMDRIGDRKVDSAKKTLTALNPDVNVVTYDVRLGADNVLQIIDGYDLIVDGTDNFPTRYLVNDAALLKRIPVVHGSIFRFEGQATVFAPYDGPCYRCLIPEPPPPELAPSCAEAGVLGVLPGIVGSIQAIEAIKVLLDLGDPLIGRLLAYDSLEQSFRTFKVNRDPNCPACGPEAKEIVIAEYDELCMPHPKVAPA